MPLPWIQAEPEWLRAQQAAGRPVVRFGDIPLDWTDFRLTLRQTADILRRYEALDRAEHEQILALAREGNALQPLVSAWYAATSGVDAADAVPHATPRANAESRSGAGAGDAAVPGPLRRSADAAGRLLRLAPRPLPVLRLGAGLRGDHPERRSPPDLRPLHRPVDFRHLTCPFCANDDRSQVTSFATRDGRYRVYACDVCRRYLKAYDAQKRRAAGDGGGRYDRHAAARRGGDAARLRRLTDIPQQIGRSGCIDESHVA